MEKYKLLKDIGFSDEYIDKLKQYENDSIEIQDSDYENVMNGIIADSDSNEFDNFIKDSTTNYLIRD